MPSEVDLLLKAVRPRLAKWVQAETQNYVSSTSGIVDHGDLTGLADDDHSIYVHINSSRTITAQHDFAPTSTQAPFTLGVNAQGQLVTGLNADLLDGYETSTNPTGSQVVVSHSSGYVQAPRFGAGVSPSYPLHVVGESYFGGVGVNAPIRMDSGKAIRSLGSNGGFIYVDFGNLHVRDADATTSAGLMVGSTGRFSVDYTTGDTQVQALGIGLAPLYPLTIRSTNQPQFALQYDASTYVNFYTTSSGNFYAYSTGNQIFRRTTADTSSSFYFFANNDSFVNIRGNYDNSATAIAGIIIQDNVNNEWGIWKNADNKLLIYDYDSTSYIMELQQSADVLWTPQGNYRVQIPSSEIRYEYDASNYAAVTVDASGELAIDATGDVVELKSANSLQSDSFISQSTGWRVTYAGNADFRYIFADELRVKAFTAEVYQSLVGAMIVTKSRAKLSRDFIVPLGLYSITGVDQTNDYFIIAGNHHSDGLVGVGISVSGSTGNDGVYYIDHTYYNSGTTSTWVYVTTDIPSGVADGTLQGIRTYYTEDLEGLEGTDTFSNSDWIRFHVIDMSGGGLVVADVWGTSNNYVDQGGGEQSHSLLCVDDGGYQGSVVYTGSIVLDYGQSGDGTWEVTVLDQGNSPYSQVTTWTTNPYTPANHTVHTRVGNIYGISSVDEFGIWAGDGATNDDSWLRVTDQNAIFNNILLRVRSGTTDRVLASPDGYISAGNTAPTTYNSGVGFWAGTDGASSADIFVGNSAGTKLTYDGSAGQLRIWADSSNYMQASGTNLTFMANGLAVITLNSPGTGDAVFGSYASGDPNMFWDSSANELKFRTGTSAPELWINTSGTLVAGGGNVTLDSDGIVIDVTGDYDFENEISWYDGGTEVMSLNAWRASAQNEGKLRVYGRSGETATLKLDAIAYSTNDVEVLITAGNSANSSTVSLNASSTLEYINIIADDGVFLFDKVAVGTSSTPAAYGDLFAYNDVDAYLGEVRIKSDEAGSQYRRDGFIVADEHFNTSSAPSGWSSAGSPFVSGSPNYSTASCVRLGSMTNQRAFFYRTLSNVPNYYASVCFASVYTGAYAGVRIDNGSDNYYCEYIIKLGSGNTFTPYIAYRNGSGDTRHETSGTGMVGNPFPTILQLNITGTRWSSWGANGLLRKPGTAGYIWSPNIGVSGSLAFTPTRMGFVCFAAATSASWETFYCDFFAY